MADRLAALGFRHHTGWAAAVAVAGEPSDPDLLVRRRIDLSSRGTPRQVYHAVRNRPLEVAEERIQAAKVAARIRAGEAIGLLLADIESMGCKVAAAGLAADLRQLPSLERILSAHVLWHSAEGDMFREAIADAALAQDLQVVQLPPAEIEQIATADLDLEPGHLQDILQQLGKEVGPPWQKDHRHAALAAMLALASAPSTVS